MQNLELFELSFVLALPNASKTGFDTKTLAAIFSDLAEWHKKFKMCFVDSVFPAPVNPEIKMVCEILLQVSAVCAWFAEIKINCQFVRILTLYTRFYTPIV